ncbi:MAG TPA: PfkB family carbohydrate kinase [Gammaproteobacteria bacterium]|nr:PfkB family carbohydrate kinase [Gammaproteobacteria bacterium]
MASILIIGNAAVDIINRVERYPPEDAEVRALDQRRVRGGNAANTAVVLAQLGHACAWGGTLADDPEAAVIRDDLTGHGVDLGPAHEVPGGTVPTSYVTLSAATGSRTIVHYRDLPEYPAKAFAALDLSGYDWVHFEGRNLEGIGPMLERLRTGRPDLPCSLEVEKPRAGIEALFPWVDLLLFSRVYAEANGFAEPEAFLGWARQRAPAADRVCAWGADGAYGLDKRGEGFAVPAFPPPQVVDTLGAGDVFNAGVIDALVAGRSPAAAVEAGARLAGRKCGQEGLDGLA